MGKLKKINPINYLFNEPRRKIDIIGYNNSMFIPTRIVD